MRHLAPLAFALLCTALPAHAAPGSVTGGAPTSLTAKAEALQLEARPLFGQGAPATSGWISYVVSLTNRGQETLVGRVRIQERNPTEGEPTHVYAEVAFSVAPASVEHVELPIHDAAVADLLAIAVDEVGKPLASVGAGVTTPSEPLLVDFTEPSRIGQRVAGRALTTRFVPSSFAHYAVPALAVSQLQRDLLDDQLLLPRFVGSYSSATLVLLRSSQLNNLTAERSSALIAWVLSGGSLAIVIDRPDDIGSAPLQALAGGEISEQAPDGESGAGLEPVPGATGRRLNPADDVAEELVIYSGGNLRPSPWGSAASYGLGEIHLLAFDPTSSRQASDRWVQQRILDLCSYAWDRNAQLVQPLGSTALENQVPEGLRRVLDPSQGKLWVIVAAGFLLIAYALFAGPINFYLARRAGNPIRALWRVPLWAITASASLVLLGMTSKGGSGHAHRLTLVESGAGIGRGAALRYRALFTDTEKLSVAPTLSGSLLDVLGPRSQVSRSLTFNRYDAKIENLRHRPWQTVFVREDGMVQLNQGVSLLGSRREISVINRTGHDLTAVLLHVPGGDLRFFPRVVSGETKLASTGDLVRVGTGASSRGVHALDIVDLRYRLERAAPGCAAAWLALHSANSRSVDWWPADVPVLLAQVDVSARGRDSDLPLEEDRVLLRVVGYGGTP